MSDEKAKGRKESDDLPFRVDLGKGWAPLEYVLLVKCLNPEGIVRYREMTSQNLHPVEALGMATTFADTMRSRLMAGARTEEG